MFTKRAFLSALLASAGTAVSAVPLDRSLRPVLRNAELRKRAAPDFQKILADARLNGAIGFAVADARTGQVHEAHNLDMRIAPASVTKSLTALYALDALGPGFRFQTRVIATGPVANGRLNGDLVLVGGGDPTLDTDDLAALAAGVKAAGIREISGAFRVADGALPRVRSISDEQPDHVGYSPAVSGIALNFNRVHFEWKRSGNGYAVTMDARTANVRPQVSTARMQVVNRSTPVYTYKRSGDVDDWTVARGALGNGGARWLPVRNPGLYAGDVFRTLARSQGIVLPAAKLTRQTPRGDVVAQKNSAPLRDILQGMLKFSNNLTAEMVGLYATRARTGGASGLVQSARQMNLWAKERFGVSGINVVDHSGLGAKSRVTAAALVQVLAAAAVAENLQPILKDIPIRDAQGRAVKGHPVKVVAKTGTLNFVSCLAGYVDTDGGKMAFAILTADEQTRARIGRDNREAPQGARSWNRRSRAMQQALLKRWGTVYGA